MSSTMMVMTIAITPSVNASRRPLCMVRRGSRQAQVLVSLHAQAPARMGQAIGDRGGSRLFAIGSVHRLQEEAFEIEPGEPLGIDADLRKDQFEFLPRRLRQDAVGL